MNYSNFEKHLQKIYSEIYNEPRSLQHVNATREMLEEFCKDLSFSNVIELGCGTAPALDFLKGWGKETMGVTLGKEEVNHPALREDMHFTVIPDQSYDMVIARHILEHSLMPLILLMEMRRIVRKYAVVVVPIPDERMIQHKNHYSVFPKENWDWLFKLSNWKILKFKQVDFCKEPDYIYKEYRYLLEGI